MTDNKEKRDCSTCIFFVFYAGCSKIMECDAYDKWEGKNEVPADSNDTDRVRPSA